MFLQIAYIRACVLRKCVVTLGAAERFVSSVGSFMAPQGTNLVAFVVTLRAAERFVTSVSSLMHLQITLLFECFFTMAARESCFTFLHGAKMRVTIIALVKRVSYEEGSLKYLDST